MPGGENRSQREIIDVHIHLTPPEVIAREEDYKKEEPYFDLLSSNPGNKFVTSEDLIDHLDKAGISQAIVFGFAFQKQENCRLVNDYIIEAIKKYPERLIGFAVVNPLKPGAAAEICRCHQEGLQGVGELFPEGQGFDLTKREEMQELTATCQELSLPIMIHLNEPIGHDYPGKTGDSLESGIKLAENFPANTFIYSHWGGGLIFYELMPEIASTLQNVYYDTAASPFLYDKKIYQAVKAAGLIDKVLLGSDYPLLSPDRYLAEIKDTDLSQAERDKVLFSNAKELFNL